MEEERTFLTSDQNQTNSVEKKLMNRDVKILNKVSRNLQKKENPRLVSSARLQRLQSKIAKTRSKYKNLLYLNKLATNMWEPKLKIQLIYYCSKENEMLKHKSNKTCTESVCYRKK